MRGALLIVLLVMLLLSNGCASNKGAIQGGRTHHGAAMGALIGTALFPGIGTALGAGLGALGDKAENKKEETFRIIQIKDELQKQLELREKLETLRQGFLIP